MTPKRAVTGVTLAMYVWPKKPTHMLYSPLPPPKEKIARLSSTVQDVSPGSDAYTVTGSSQALVGGWVGG